MIAGTGQPALGVSALAIDPDTPQTVYAAYGGRGIMGPAAGVFVSRDGGVNWSAVNEGLSDLWVLALAMDQQRPGVLYAGTQGSGVFQGCFQD